MLRFYKLLHMKLLRKYTDSSSKIFTEMFHVIRNPVLQMVYL